MSQLNENLVAHLDGAQALELVRVLEIQAFWENLRESVGQKDLPTSHLKDRQKAYEAYRSRLAGYTAKYRSFPLPELTQNSPKWATQWFRVVRTVLLRVTEVPANEIPVELLSKAHRLAERIVARMKKASLEPFARPASWNESVNQIDALLAVSSDEVAETAARTAA